MGMNKKVDKICSHASCKKIIMHFDLYLPFGVRKHYKYLNSKLLTTPLSRVGLNDCVTVKNTKPQGCKQSFGRTEPGSNTLLNCVLTGGWQ